MKIDVQYAAGCPHVDATVTRVREVAREIGVGIDLSLTLVTTAEQATRCRHLGSPTVQIDGLDIDPNARVLQFSGFS